MSTQPTEPQSLAAEIDLLPTKAPYLGREQLAGKPAERVLGACADDIMRLASLMTIVVDHYSAEDDSVGWVAIGVQNDLRTIGGLVMRAVGEVSRNGIASEMSVDQQKKGG